MFNIGLVEVAFIAVGVLVFIGPSKLPEFAKEAGKIFVKFRKFTTEARNTVDSVLKEAEREIILENHRKINEKLIDVNPAHDQAVSTDDEVPDEEVNAIEDESEVVT